MQHELKNIVHEISQGIEKDSQNTSKAQPYEQFLKNYRARFPEYSKMKKLEMEKKKTEEEKQKQEEEEILKEYQKEMETEKKQNQEQKLQDRKTLISDLFYGAMKQFIETKEEDDSLLSFINEMKFGQIILDISTSDLYSSLDEYTSETSIEFTTPKKFKTQAQKRTSVIQFPPVLILQLQRVTFDQKQKKSVKNNSKFSFDQVIHLDRYLDQNFEKTSAKRKQNEILRNKKNDFEKELQKLNEYGEKKQPLTSYLKTVKSYFESCAKKTEENADQDEKSKQYKTSISLIETETEKIESQVEDLSKKIKNNAEEMEKMFEDMKELPYYLFSILVHRGVSLSGHYWAFIYDYSQECWWKFNDQVVTKVTSEEVFKNSYGDGMDSANAYCLIYLNEEVHRSMQKQKIFIEKEAEEKKEEIIGAQAHLQIDFVHEPEKNQQPRAQITIDLTPKIRTSLLNFAEKLKYDLFIPHEIVNEVKEENMKFFNEIWKWEDNTKNNQRSAQNTIEDAPRGSGPFLKKEQTEQIYDATKIQKDETKMSEFEKKHQEIFEMIKYECVSEKNSLVDSSLKSLEHFCLNISDPKITDFSIAKQLFKEIFNQDLEVEHESNNINAIQIYRTHNYPERITKFFNLKIRRWSNYQMYIRNYLCGLNFLMNNDLEHAFQNIVFAYSNLKIANGNINEMILFLLVCIKSVFDKAIETVAQFIKGSQTEDPLSESILKNSLFVASFIHSVFGSKNFDSVRFSHENPDFDEIRILKLRDDFFSSLSKIFNENLEILDRFSQENNSTCQTIFHMYLFLSIPDQLVSNSQPLPIEKELPHPNIIESFKQILSKARSELKTEIENINEFSNFIKAILK
ncbi:ubiquitin carboxyl-terminal hydrolase 28 [Anaeramoeba ignava]|uniref:ubiquitinyl hydrolase 1 n=1 Tax=Anaeramoeba ignava TaxID=1746090 RepID=A0A9Q0LDP0_ANAIG|nr:ubiquitin carboxyl-terminal hydrolase 28 [Anaeramoeba ignava]